MKKIILITLIVFFASSVMTNAGINAVIKKQRMGKNTNKATKARVYEIFNIAASTIEELQRKGVKFDIPPTYNFQSGEDDGVLASRLNKRVILGEGESFGVWWDIFFSPAGGNTNYIHMETDLSGKKLEIDLLYKDPIYCSVFDSKCVLSNKKEIKSSVIQAVEKSME